MNSITDTDRVGRSAEKKGHDSDRYITPISAWALGFGCVIGWGSFVMPGTNFLPDAGFFGAISGLVISALLIITIAANYTYLMKKIPRNGGSYTFTTDVLGADHAFLAIWSLVLAYLSLLWANATAFVLIGRIFIDDALQWGFHYKIAGYDVYCGEVFVTLLVQVSLGLIAAYTKRFVNILRTILAVALFISVIIVFIMMLSTGIPFGRMPLFSTGAGKGVQILSIAILAPWLYVGFETITVETQRMKFSGKKLLSTVFAAVTAGLIIYVLLTIIAAVDIPEGVDSWLVYGEKLQHLNGIESMPVFNNIYNRLGFAGLALIGVSVVCALSTSVLGFYHASARILQTMSNVGLLSAGLSAEENGVPKRAVFTAMIISLPMPFLGRTAIGWNADVSTLSVAIVYVYISICTYVLAKKDNDRRNMYRGMFGIVSLSLVFLMLLIPNIFSENEIATEAYLMLAVWSLAGLVYYRVIFKKDKEGRYGKSTVMWILMLFLLFLSTNVWMRLHDEDKIATILGYRSEEISDILMRSSVLQIVIIVVALVIMFNLFTTLLKRERQMEADKRQAELEKEKADESSKAKSIFLSNMSHDIRTPMNAIIGYTNLAEDEDNDEAALREYLAKIKTSSHHLLALINDVLEMSRIESGKMSLEPVGVNLKVVLDEVRDMFSTQMEEKNIEFTVDYSHIKNAGILCDKNRLNRVMLNLLSNAYKFTPKGGHVSVTAWELEAGDDRHLAYELRVADSGIGMTQEFAERVFEAFERERTSTVSGIQGTGLGMAITKSIIDLMGGTIEVNTAPGSGTEFVIKLEFEKDEASDSLQGNETKENDISAEASQSGTTEYKDKKELDFTKIRFLLAEDMFVNREIAIKLLNRLGFMVEAVENGKEAVDKVAASKPGYYDAVLMDIQMPVMDGYEAARTIRALEDDRLKDIPIIAMTANAFTEDINKAKEAGMNGHIAKPINVDDMVATIKEVLSK